MDDFGDLFVGNAQSTTKNISKVKKPIAQPSPKTTKLNPTKVPLISMKAFIHNFKKFYKEKTRIRNLLSEAAAKQRNISLIIYVKKFQVLKYIYIQKHTYEDVKSMLKQTRIEEQTTLSHFQELAFRDLHQATEKTNTHIYVRDPEVDYLADLCQSQLDALFLQKETSFFEKRALIKFLTPLLDREEYRPVTYELLRDHWKAIQYIASNNLRVVGEFIQHFQQVISQLEENHNQQDLAFRLADIAHFLYEQKYRRADLDIVMKFVSKLKQLHNKIHQNPKDTPIDGDRPLSLQVMMMAYNIASQKDKVQSDVITEVINNIKHVLNDHIRPETVERVRRVMEHNLIGDYLCKYFKDLDHQIGLQLSNIQHISQLIMFRIENLDLRNKQEQLEVLLAFIHRVQDSHVDTHMADLLQRHGNTVQQLLFHFEGELEDAQVKAHSNLSRRDNNTTDMEMPQVKQVLYADDEELKSGAVEDNRVIIDPYKLDQADQHIRRPKQFDFSMLLIERNPQVQEFQRALQQQSNPYGMPMTSNPSMNNLNQPNDPPKAYESVLAVSQQQKSNIQLPVALDPMYESEFEKLKEELKPNNKTEMIGQLQSQIENLRREVELQKRLQKK